MPQLKGENGQDEIELDIDSLDLVTLNRLWNFVKGKKKGRPPGPGQPSARQIGSGDAQVDAGPDQEKHHRQACVGRAECGHAG